MKSAVQSMTGFSSVEGMVANTQVRLEIKTLNHRFLDLKIRLPRDYSPSLEMSLRTLLQSEYARGSVEFRIEKVSSNTQSTLKIEPNLALAAHYYESLLRLQKTLGLADSIRTIDIATLPEVISKESTEAPSETLWGELEPIAKKAILQLKQMRAHEGANLARALSATLLELEQVLTGLRNRREEVKEAYLNKLQEKIAQVFEAHPVSEPSVKSVLETRIAQELALLLDKTDIEEELTRFKGHLDHFNKILQDGGAVGRKLDFVLQELNREINTLGNKAQDFSMSEEVVKVKVRLEQLREQVMNLE